MPRSAHAKFARGSNYFCTNPKTEMMGASSGMVVVVFVPIQQPKLVLNAEGREEAKTGVD